MPTKKAAPKAAPAATKQSTAQPTKQAAKPAGATKAAPPVAAKKAATVNKAAVPDKTPTKAVPKAAAKAVAPAKTPAAKAPAAKAAAVSAPATPTPAAPAKKPKKVVLEKFLLEQRDLLLEERATYVASAAAFKAEADMLALDMEPGDVQFDEESGEGATANVDRERDLALSAQAKAAVEEIDEALSRINAGTYGKCNNCGQAIPKPRLKAIPHASLCVACKSGGLSRR